MIEGEFERAVVIQSSRFPLWKFCQLMPGQLRPHSKHLVGETGVSQRRILCQTALRSRASGEAQDQPNPTASVSGLWHGFHAVYSALNVVLLSAYRQHTRCCTHTHASTLPG